MALMMQFLQLPKTPLRVLSLLGLAVFFIAIGCDHFIRPNFYVGIMPPYLPAHLELVYLSGLFEILGGMALLIDASRRLAGVGLMVLLVAVYPANVHQNFFLSWISLRSTHVSFCSLFFCIGFMPARLLRHVRGKMPLRSRIDLQLIDA